MQKFLLPAVPGVVSAAKPAFTGASRKTVQQAGHSWRKEVLHLQVKG